VPGQAVTDVTHARRRRLGEHVDRLLGIPHLTPQAAGLFRIAIGLAVTSLIWNNVAVGYPTGTAVPLSPGVGYGVGSWPLSHWIRGHPDAHVLIYRITLAAAGALTLGLWTRIAAAVLWCGLFLLIGASLTTSGNHTWGAPWVALFGLLLTPLGNAWSLDSVVHRSRGRAESTGPAPIYGFAIWWIGLVLGLAFVAAAYAKVDQSGLAWATGGAIRYHFVEDASHAPVAWGLWIAGRPALAVALSTTGLLVEALFILVIFCRRDAYRAAFGAAFLAMHAGFFLFQGVLWLPWIAMSLAFLPWQTASRRLQQAVEPAPPRSTLRPAHALAVVVLVTQQAYASARMFEYEPLLSHFPMYSATFSSWEAFFETKRWYKYQSYRFYARDGTGARSDITAPSSILSPLDVDRLIDTLKAAYEGEDVPARSIPALAAIHDRLTARFGPETVVEVDVDVQTVNFDSMRFELAADDLHAFTLRLSPVTLEFVAPGFRTLVR
jgi:hypothetical protein